MGDMEEVLEMNKYEKMSWEVIKEKKKVEFNFVKIYINLVLFFMILSVLFGIFLFLKRNIDIELILQLILLGMIFSFFLGIFFLPIIHIFLKISNYFILTKDKEYQLAKKVILDYENKVIEIKKKQYEEEKKKECIAIICKEKEKCERINELERYLKAKEKDK
jgi:hypothetical protein